MIMPSLREAQEAFARGLLDAAGTAVLSHLAGARGMDAATGLAVYRNNTFSNYRGALREAYPVVLRLVGEDFFGQAADDFIRVVPSAFGDVNAYGAEFGDFLADYPGAIGLAYLPDVARLEWAVHSAFQAIDADAMDIAGLAAVPAERLDSLRFALHPSAALVVSPWPILAIWRANQPGFTGDESIDLASGGNRLLVLRRGHDVELEPLGAAEYRLLSALACGVRLGAALEAALAEEAAFDLGACLQHHVAAGTLVDFTLALSPNPSPASGRGEPMI
jgi:hypothetical protein